MGDGFFIEIKYENQKQSTKIEPEVLENQKQIIELVKMNIYIAAYEIAKKIGISHRKVQENMAKLKEVGILLRIGLAKGGHWEVIKK